MVISPELCKWLRFDYAEKCFLLKAESIKEKETHTFSWWLSYNNRSSDTEHKTKPNKNQQEENICVLGDFVVLAGDRFQVKESKNINFDLARELMNLLNIRVMVKPIVISALGAVPK